jgi:hypothetical protein
MFIPDPDFFIHPRSQTPDPGATKEEREKTINKIENYVIFFNGREKMYFLPKKLSLISQKYGFGIRDPRSGIRDPGSEIRDPR